jgi:hypothetical protein
MNSVASIHLRLLFFNLCYYFFNVFIIISFTIVEVIFCINHLIFITVKNVYNLISINN